MEWFHILPVTTTIILILDAEKENFNKPLQLNVYVQEREGGHRQERKK